MAAANLNNFLRRLGCGMAVEMLGDQSDRQLVERALAQSDEVALQAIVHRHSAMVYQVCWRVLQHSQDTEDAFQATFLVLAQKLGTLRKHASLASWLHGVAHRVAVRAKLQATARRRRETQAPLCETMPPDDITWKDLRVVLDAELSQLPDKWRLPLVLCYLEGQTQDEAAIQLAWSKSTLRRRLEEARNALGHRLRGRGIMLSAALSAALLSDSIVSAAPRLVASTVEAALMVAAGETLATASTVTVRALTEGVLKTMFWNKLKTVTAMALVVAMIAAGGILITGHMLAAQQLQPEKPSEGKRDADPNAAAVGGGQNPAPPQVGTEKKLAGLEQELAAATPKGDVAFLDRVLAKEYRLTGPDGAVTDKKAELQKAKAGNPAYEPIAATDLQVNVYGDAAVLTGRRAYQVGGNEFRFTSVYVLRDGRWQCVARQVTSIPKP